MVRLEGLAVHPTNNFCCLSGDSYVYCPTISEQLIAPKMIPLSKNVQMCLNGKELMMDAIIPIAYFGGGPYVHRNPGKQVRLGHGSYMSVLEILSTKLGFKATLRPARSVVDYMVNVR